MKLNRAELSASMGTRIRAYRKQKHMTQQQLAKKAGLNSNTINGVELGRMEARISTLAAIAQVLDVSVLDLLPRELL